MHLVITLELQKSKIPVCIHKKIQGECESEMGRAPAPFFIIMHKFSTCFAIGPVCYPFPLDLYILIGQIQRGGKKVKAGVSLFITMLELFPFCHEHCKQYPYPPPPQFIFKVNTIQTLRFLVCGLPQSDPLLWILFWCLATNQKK